MKRLLAAVYIGCLTVGSALAWEPAHGPLTTRWTKEVSPSHVWTEYPRPQLVRKDWLNLNGLWEYAITPSGQVPQFFLGGKAAKILVPFPVESALSGVMRRLDDKSHLIYQRTFKIPHSWRGQRVLLHFGAVDFESTVFVNQSQVGTHRGGYDPFTFDVTDALTKSGDQQLLVDVTDPTEAGQPRGKQSREPKGIYYTPSSGIWQTVWLEPVPMTGIDALWMTPDVDHQSVRISVNVKDAVSGDVVEAMAYDGANEVGRASAGAGEAFQIEMPKPKLWFPDHPFLYDLKVRLRRGKKTLDAVESYFAMRKIEIGKDTNGVTRPLLNGKPIFQVGPLDQGFWPDGLYTPPTDAAMRYDLEMTKKLGFNMTRKHVKVEPDRWYYYCDKMGLLVWQDMPAGNNVSDADKKEFESELRAMIATHRNHPSIVMWVVFNEGWGQFDTERLTGLVKQIDPSRLVDNATGWTDKQVGDVIDIHKYPGPGSPEPEEHRAAVLGEFGGLGLGVDGHTWAKKTWGYQGMASRSALTDKYVALLQKAKELKDQNGLSAVVYTQITDVETECNGLMTYDRAILKPNEAAVREVNLKLQDR